MLQLELSHAIAFELNMIHPPTINSMLVEILILGIGTQWLAWRLNLPSILLLLAVGLIAGETGLIKPDLLLGQLLLPLVSFSVALILFEGSLSLKLLDLRAAGRLIYNMISMGILCTWLLTTLAGMFILKLPLQLSLLIAAILSVTGPTVIMPMLRYIRPPGQLARILRWESIVNDPLGTLLAVLVFESILASGIESTALKIAVSVGRTLLTGCVLGFSLPFLFAWMLHKKWIPSFLQSPVMLMVLCSAFVISNHFQEDSGLFTVTLMGIVLANQRLTDITHIMEFKENLGLILLSCLFILLSARLHLSDFSALGWPGFAFLLALILIVRPLAVFLATRKTKLTWNDRLFLMAMAPRGIVAAAISSTFALELKSAGYSQSNVVFQSVFLVIVGTVTIYGLLALPLARYLKLAGKAQGVLLVGANAWALEIGKALRQWEIPVRIVDSDMHNNYVARMQGFETIHGNILSGSLFEDVDLSDLGYVFALTSNNEVNALAGVHFKSIFGKENIYQLPPVGANTQVNPKEDIAEHLQGQFLIDSQYTSTKLEALLADGWGIKISNLTAEYGYEDLLATYDQKAIPLFSLDDNGQLHIYTADAPFTPQANQKLAFLTVRPESKGQEPQQRALAQHKTDQRSP